MPIHTPQARATTILLTLLSLAAASGPAAADPNRLDTIAELLAGEAEINPSQAPDAVPADTAGELATDPENPALLPPSALPLDAPPGGTAAKAIAGPTSLADLADYVRARVPDTHAHDPLAEACALAAKLNPGKPTHQKCKGRDGNP